MARYEPHFDIPGRPSNRPRACTIEIIGDLEPPFLQDQPRLASCSPRSRPTKYRADWRTASPRRENSRSCSAAGQRIERKSGES